MAIEDFRHSTPLRVRWAEVDAQSIVFNGHYLLYADVCITEYWRSIGVRYPVDVVDTFGVDFYVVKSTLEYHAPDQRKTVPRRPPRRSPIRCAIASSILKS